MNKSTSHIYIDGVDGTGKTTLVKKLIDAGYQNIVDRSILTKMSTIFISELPDRLPSDDVITKQIQTIKKTYLPVQLTRNRDVMMKLDPNIQSNTLPSAIHLILDAEPETCIKRLNQRLIKLDAWENENCIKYFRSKYLFMAYKYNIPIINTNHKNSEDVYMEALDLINENKKYVPPYPYVSYYTTVFDPNLLELEWIHFGKSSIIFADSTGIVTNIDDLDIENYQKNVVQKIAKQNLEQFIFSIVANG